MALPFLDPDEEPFHLRQAISQGWKFLRGLLNGEKNTYGAAGIDPSWLGAANWLAYTPALEATGSNPSLGTGATRIGRYTQIGGTVHGSVLIQFGSSSSSGSGFYIVTLPVEARVTGWGSLTAPAAGTANLFDSSSGTRVVGGVYIAGDGEHAAIVGANTIVTHNIPWAWSSGDFLALSFTYEAEGM